MPETTIQRLTGDEIEPYVPELARLRMEIFRDFPYLYEGSQTYEEKYLRTYSQTPESVFVVVFAEGEVVGVSTGLPMEDGDEAFRRPFVERGYDLSRIFYFGESVLRSAYRGQGIGHRFFEEREAHARALGRFEYATFSAVERPADHPMRPEGYQPLDPFWKRRGYEKHPELRAYYTWRDIGEAAESAKPMVFWMKRL